MDIIERIDTALREKARQHDGGKPATLRLGTPERSELRKAIGASAHITIVGMTYLGMRIDRGTDIEIVWSK